MQPAQEFKILQRRQVCFQARQMTEIRHAAGAQVASRFCSIDLDHPSIGPKQARKYPQQRGLAGTVAALHKQGFPHIHGEIQWPEHRCFIAGEA